MDRAAAKLFSFELRNRDEANQLGPVWADYVRACGNTPRLPQSTALQFAQRCMRFGADDLAESALRALARRTSLPAGVDATWFVLALRAAEGSAPRRARLEFILQHFPQSSYAAKARFLLQA